MDLIYWFDDEQFDYEIDVKEYIDSLNMKEKIELAKDVYDKMNEEDRKYALDEYNIETLSDIDMGNVDSVEWMNDVAFDVDNYDIIKDIAEDDMKDFFYSDARDAYDDSKLSPEEYNDWRQSDYI